MNLLSEIISKPVLNLYSGKIEILMQNGQLDEEGNPIIYNLKNEPVTLNFTSTPIVKEFNKTIKGTVVTGKQHIIGHTYTLTILNLEQLERKLGMMLDLYKE